MKSFFRTKQLLSLFICLVIVSSLAIVKHGELLGHSFRSEQKPQAANNDTLRILGNGTAVINTSALASDITGYGGKVPLNIVIKNGVVENIVTLKNDETKEFFDNASALFEKWKGRTIDEAMNMKVDAGRKAPGKLSTACCVRRVCRKVKAVSATAVLPDKKSDSLLKAKSSPTHPLSKAEGRRLSARFPMEVGSMRT